MDTFLLLVNMACQGLCGLVGLNIDRPTTDEKTALVEYRHGRRWMVLLIALGMCAAVAQQQLANAENSRLRRDIQQMGLAQDAAALGLGRDLEALLLSGRGQARVYGYVFYAYEWNYRGSVLTKDPKDWARLIDDRVPLRKAYSPGVHRLDLGALNNTAGTLVGTTIRAVTSPGVNVVRGGCWERPRLSYVWFGRIDRTFYCRISPMRHRYGLHANYPLEMRFAKPGTYRVEYTFTAPEQETVTGEIALMLEG